MLDRTLVLETERRKEFVSEGALLRRIEKQRNLLWTELLRSLNRIVAQYPRQEHESDASGFRMADFAAFARLVARAEGDEGKADRILAKLESRRTGMLLAEEPIKDCLEKWLEQPQNHGRRMSSAMLQEELAAIASRMQIFWPYRNAHSLGQRLPHITNTLSQLFRIETESDSANQVWHRFWPRAESLNRAESRMRVIQAA